MEHLYHPGLFLVAITVCYCDGIWLGMPLLLVIALLTTIMCNSFDVFLFLLVWKIYFAFENNSVFEPSLSGQMLGYQWLTCCPPFWGQGDTTSLMRFIDVNHVTIERVTNIPSLTLLEVFKSTCMHALYYYDVIWAGASYKGFQYLRHHSHSMNSSQDKQLQIWIIKNMF